MAKPSDEDKKLAWEYIQMSPLSSSIELPRKLADLRTEKEAAVKQARAEGKQDGLNKALEIIRFICKNDCEVYMCVFDTIQKVKGLK